MNRKLYLDILKILGSFAIVLLHVLSNTIHEVYPFVSETQRIVVHSLHQLLYTAVPIFMMVTGAAFLAERKICTYGSIQKHIIKIVVCIILFGAAFWTVECILSGSAWNVKDMCLAILTDATWSHMWYLYRLLGIYLLLPVISVFVKYTKVKEQLIFGGGILFFNCVYPYIGGLVGFVPATTFSIEGMFLFYVVCGGLLGQMSFEQSRKVRWLSLLICVTAGTMVLWKGSQGVDIILGEDYIVSLIFAIAAFLSIKGFLDGRQTPLFLSHIGQAALGIYILHPVVLHFLVRILKWNPQLNMPLVSIPLMVIVVWGVTCVGVVLIRKISFVRRYIL